MQHIINRKLKLKLLILVWWMLGEGERPKVYVGTLRWLVIPCNPLRQCLQTTLPHMVAT